MLVILGMPNVWGDVAALLLPLLGEVDIADSGVLAYIFLKLIDLYHEASVSTWG